jgi:hypothetical protein
MVVHREMFRSFTLQGDSKYPIAYRGDDRPLHKVMETGFRPRTTVLAKYADRLGEIREELEKKYHGEENSDALINSYLSNMVAVNVGNVDIDKETAVCCTRDFRVAGMFPFDPNKPAVLEKPTRVYAVRMRGWLETYRVQAALAPHLTYSQEVACLGIAPEDILGCLTVNRKLDGNNIVLSIGGSEEPGEHDEGDDPTDFDGIVESLSGEFSVPVPRQKTTDTVELEVEKKITHITAAIRSLTGAAGPGGFPPNANVIRDNRLRELSDYRIPSGGRLVQESRY